MNKLVSIVIINWNNKKYIDRCMEAIMAQSYSPMEIIFIDNNSKDCSYEHFGNTYSKDKCIAVKNKENLGYSGAANQGINMAKGEYIMILNPDIVMEWNFVEKLCTFMEGDMEIGAVSGKLLKYDFEKNTRLNYIDSAGIEIYRDRTSRDIGQNEEDKGQYNSTRRVFGICGAAPMYRKSALADIAVNGEYFDEDFFAYKEDIDLSWRLNLAGFKCMYYPEAVAYHGRGLGGVRGGIWKVIKNRNSQSKFLRGISSRNQLMLLFKNEQGKPMRRDIFKIYLRVLKMVVFSLAFERFNFQYMFQAIKLRKKMKEKKLLFLENHRGRVADIDFLITR
ncbi:MAG: glycosyltransferase family 2 protein [Bacillota bacterium]|nr:glycosyltransferase family 2 protein [Bacillota bacterium]